MDQNVVSILECIRNKELNKRFKLQDIKNNLEIVKEETPSQKQSEGKTKADEIIEEEESSSGGEACCSKSGTCSCESF